MARKRKEADDNTFMGKAVWWVISLVIQISVVLGLCWLFHR